MKQVFQRELKILFGIILFQFMWSCANPGTPQGGPKDETPPVIRKTVPEQNALNFKGKKIVITFDELIQVKDVSQKLVVSPPMNKAPSVMARGNELLIQIEDTLQDNTTYTFDFADAVSDNNEGNVYPNFTFSFSTGKVVDSMQVSGHLWEAETLKPLQGIMVLLHSNLADSALRTLVPVRLGKTDINGAFTIQNVRPGKYRIYALEDANRNYKYDQSGERIAWLDSIIVPSYEYKSFTDSVGKDSVRVYEKLVYTPDSLRLFLFSEDIYDQYLSKDERKEKARLDVIFNEPLDSFKIEPVNERVPDNWAIYEWSNTRDSVSVWMRDSLMYDRDSLTFSLQYAGRDSLDQIVIKNDTITFYYFETEIKESKRRRKGEDDAKKQPSVSIGGISNILNIYSPLRFYLKTMPVAFDPKGIKMYEQVDTIFEPREYSLIQDSLNFRKFTIDYHWNPGGIYELEIDSATFKDIYGFVNNPVKQKINVKTKDKYSTLYVTVEDPGENWLLQILNSKEAVVRQAQVPSSGKMAFTYLNPAEYMFRMVIDVNRNREWDTGNYELKQQPEEVFYYPEKVSLRADWEHEVVWNKNMSDIFTFVKKFRQNKTATRRR